MKHFFEGMICGLLNGFFGSGGGVAAVPILEHEIRKGSGEIPPEEAARRAHANSVAVIFALSLTAAASYFFSGSLDMKSAWGYIPAGAAGALAGSLFLRKIRAAWLQRLFGALICAAAVRTLLT